MRSRAAQGPNGRLRCGTEARLARLEISISISISISRPLHTLQVLDDECAHRDYDLEESERDCAATAAVARRAEAEQERQLEQYASVRNKRLALAHGLDQACSAA